MRSKKSVKQPPASGLENLFQISRWHESGYSPVFISHEKFGRDHFQEIDSVVRADQSDYNKGGMVTFILSMIASMGIMVYVAFFSGGIDLKEIKPEAPQQQAPGAAPAEGQPAAPAEGKQGQLETPWIPTSELVAKGEKLYKDNCASCHGIDGKGDGPAGRNLSPKPRDLVEGQWKRGGTRLGLYEVLENGLPPSAMQSYAYMPSSDRWAMVHYVRSITQNKIADNDADVAARAASLN